MDSTDSMNDAISALNGNEFQGRPLVVNEANRRPTQAAAVEAVTVAMAAAADATTTAMGRNRR